MPAFLSQGGANALALEMPTYSIDKVTQITPGLLHSMNAKALLLDVDNTLSLPESQVPFPGTVEWAHQMQRCGFRLIVLSNNFKKRVAPFAALYDLPYVSFALKPLPLGYRRALTKLGVKRSEAVVVGDQVFTDILGANFMGMQSILVTPRAEELSVSFLRKRRHEEPVRRLMKKTGRHISPKE